MWFPKRSRGGAISFIDYYEVRNEGLPHFVHVLEQKDYLYGSHNAPHDIEVRELGTGRSRREVAWDYIKQFTNKIPGIKYNETELRCDLPSGARITLLGSENPDSLRGIYLDGCVIDEVADMPESIFPAVIRPALSDRKGF